VNRNLIRAFPQVVIFFILVSFNAKAITVDYGEFIDVWDTPNDTAELITADLAGTGWALSAGQSLTELARNDNTFYSDGLFNVPLSPTVFGYGTESTDGVWAYIGGARVDYLAVATTSNFALYGYNSSQWIGLWTTDAISDFLMSAGEGMTHITAYTVSAVPLPAAAPLFASALALFGFINHRRKTRKS
jgi:hypothetical protein